MNLIFQICFRRWGHNELDDPTFTNPSLYSVINRCEIPGSVHLYCTVITGSVQL